MQKVIAKIYLENIKNNALAFKTRSGAKLCAVVKADAYGHGAEEVALALSGIADCFAVALIEEGLSLRGVACGKDILVFTPPTTEEEAYALAANGFIATVGNLVTARLFARVCRKYGLVGRVHLKLNTGMNRYGMNPSTLGKVCRFLSGEPVLVEGAYSHLYENKRRTAERQRALFLQMQAITRRYFPQAIFHLSATYGVTLGKAFAFDMVRVGLGLYGYSPVPTDIPLQRGMEVFAKVVDSRKYAFGGAGYGRATLEKGERLAVLRVGYADGFLRRARNGAEGYEQNANDLCMDVTLRKNGKKRGAWVPVLTDAEETARLTGSIPYEVLCAATRRAERVYEIDILTRRTTYSRRKFATVNRGSDYMD